jgi:hypothetical protein
VAKETFEELLKEVIAASNRTTAASDRTTRAIRAIVSFLFIQLTFTSIAVLMFWWGANIYDSTAGFSVIIIAFTIWLMGVIFSSMVGWSELNLSGFQLNDPREDKPLIYDYSPSSTSIRYPTGGINPKVTPRNNKDASEGRVCSGCVRYTTKVYCENCGEKD